MLCFISIIIFYNTKLFFKKQSDMISSNKILKFTSIDLPGLEKILCRLPKHGQTKTASNGYFYLDIDDSYITQAHALLTNPKIQQPDYFTAEKNFIGAHISIIYPEELVIPDKSDIGRELSFTTTGAFKTKLFGKNYYVLKVESPDLIQLRAKYSLDAKLMQKGYLFDLHITFGVKMS